MTDDAGQPGTHRAARRRRSILWTVAALVLVLGGGTALVAGLIGSEGTPTPPSITDSAARPTQDAASPTPAPTSEAPSPTGETSEDDAEEAPAQESSSEAGQTSTDPTGEPEQEAPVAAPVSVSIPSVGISSDLLTLGLDGEGALEVPQGDDFDTAAWYDGSPRPGQSGPAVLLGHVSSVDRGPSVFFDLASVQVGDTIEVAREDGTTAEFEVYDLQQFPKDSFPTVQVYGPTEEPELRLITCAGTIIESTTHLSDNVIVFARQA